MFLFSKSYKRILIISLILLIPLAFLEKRGPMDIKMECKKIHEDGQICTFSCDFNVVSQKNKTTYIRFIVTHSTWAAIYDESFTVQTNKNNSHTITIPNREYTYVLKSNCFDDSGDFGAMSFSIELKC